MSPTKPNQLVALPRAVEAVELLVTITTCAWTPEMNAPWECVYYMSHESLSDVYELWATRTTAMSALMVSRSVLFPSVSF